MAVHRTGGTRIMVPVGASSERTHLPIQRAFESQLGNGQRSMWPPLTDASARPVAGSPTGRYHRAVDNVLLTAASTTPADPDLVETSAPVQKDDAMADDATTIELSRSELREVAGNAVGTAFLHPLAKATQVWHILGSAAHAAVGSAFLSREGSFCGDGQRCEGMARKGAKGLTNSAAVSVSMRG